MAKKGQKNALGAAQAVEAAADSRRDERHQRGNGQPRPTDDRDASEGQYGNTSPRQLALLPDSGNGGNGANLTRTVIARGLGVMMNVQRLRKIGAALPLLMVIVIRCGDGDACTLNYHEAAEEIGVSHATLKKWGQALKESGVVEKKARGTTGVEFQLVEDGIHEIDLMGPLEQKKARAVESVRALQRVMNDAMESCVGSLTTNEGAEDGRTGEIPA